MPNAIGRGNLWIVCCLFLFSNLGDLSASFAQSRYASVLYPDLRSVLLVIAEVDQDVRSELLAKGFGNLDSLDIVRQRAVDEANIKILNKLIEDYGWPTRNMVGEDGVKAAFLIVQHADHSYQKKMLNNIKVSFERGDLPGSDYALLLDRVLVGDGYPQRYGSQAKLENGYITLYPIENDEQVDDIRASVGLEPLSAYIRSLENLYGMPFRKN